jgi:phage terminase large subunit GpA-like protein
VFLTRNASPTLDAVFPGGTEAAVFGGLKTLVGKLVGREWTRSDGATLALSRVLLDSGWASDAVRLYARQSDPGTRLTVSKGFGVGPGQTAISDYRKRPGERIGDGWILGIAGPDRLRLLRFDTNHWKTRVADMLSRQMGSKGGITLYGRRPIDHELLAAHLASEYPTCVEARGNAVNVWTRRPDQENHLLDCLIGCAVAASVEGLSPLATIGGRAPRPRRELPSVAEAVASRRMLGWGNTPPHWHPSR